MKFIPFDRLRTGFDKLSANGKQTPFMANPSTSLRTGLSNHERRSKNRVILILSGALSKTLRPLRLAVFALSFSGYFAAGA